MKFKELKKVLSCFDIFEICMHNDLKSTSFFTNYDSIDETAKLHRLGDREVLYITAIDEKFLYISLK